MNQYFPKPSEQFEGDINDKVNLFDYVTKADIKNFFTCWCFTCFLVSLKAEVDQLDIDKLVPIPVDLNKLGDVVKNDIVKKTAYDKLVVKVNNIDTSGFDLKTNYETNKSELKNKVTIAQLFVVNSFQELITS